MISALPLLFLALGLAKAQVRNSGNGVQFLFPNEDGLRANFLDTVNISYTSPFPAPLLYTFCYNVSNHKQSIQTSLIEANPFNASHLFTLTWPDVSGCYWNLRPNTSTGYGANSFDIIVLPEGAKFATTIGLNGPAATGTTSSSTNTATATASATPPANSDADTGMSTGAKAGIGAGVGAVALLAIIGLAFFFIRKRKNKNGGLNEKGENIDGTGTVQLHGYQHVQPEETGYVSPVGVGANDTPVTELHGGVGHSYFGGDGNGKIVESGSGERKVIELPAGEHAPSQRPDGEVFEMGDGGRR